MAKTKDFKILSDYRDDQLGLDELALSIKNDGLYQPIVVTPLEDDEAIYEIVAGRRRFKAMTEYLKWESLRKNEHFIVKEGINALIAQFQENFNREDFTPIEMARLIKDIHDSKVKEHGVAIKGKTGGWGLKDTGNIIGKDSGFVSRMLSLCENEELIKDCPNIKEALETIKQQKSKSLRKKIQKEKFEKAESSDNKELEDLIKNISVDTAENFTSSLKDETIDCVLTDPPYGINYDSLVHNKTCEAYEDDQEDLLKIMRKTIPEYFRVLKPNRYCIIWTSEELVIWMKEEMIKAGFSVGPTSLYWVKLNTGGRSLNPTKTLGSQMEVAVYGWKGDAELAKPGSGNTFPFPIVRDKSRIHVAQKPEDLYSAVLETFTWKGDLVLDTFCGSCALLRACYLKGRDFIGCEKSKDNIIEAINYTRSWADEMDSKKSK